MSLCRQCRGSGPIAGGRSARRSTRCRRVIGVGGVFTAEDLRRYLAAGAEAVQLATAVMIDPEVGLRIRAELGGSAG